MYNEIHTMQCNKYDMCFLFGVQLYALQELIPLCIEEIHKEIL